MHKLAIAIVAALTIFTAAGCATLVATPPGPLVGP
jgi:hypothetical protein